MSAPDVCSLAADLLEGKRPTRAGERPRIKVPDNDERLVVVACILRDIGVWCPAELDPELTDVLGDHFRPGHFA